MIIQQVVYQTTPISLDDDPKTNQETHFTGNLERDGNTTMFFIIEEVKETTFNLSEEIVKVLQINFGLYKMSKHNNTLNRPNDNLVN